jgi:hypothetical protein
VTEKKLKELLAALLKRVTEAERRLDQLEPIVMFLKNVQKGVDWLNANIWLLDSVLPVSQVTENVAQYAGIPIEAATQAVASVRNARAGSSVYKHTR